MRKLHPLFLGMVISVLLFSCTKDKTSGSVTEEAVAQDVLTQIAAKGFSNKDVTRTDGGYIVEGDIFIGDADLKSNVPWQTLEIATEQYRTNNLVSVTGATRTITLSVSSRLPAAYVTAVDEVVNRYNAQNLTLRFSRVSSGGNIVFDRSTRGAQYLASAGFPTSTGNPHNRIIVNSYYLGNNPGTAYLATILAHEVGHCIGFRHTDYMDRSYSCGGATSNEGASTVGAVLIPGTPSGPDANSWMLACIGTGVNRPFNANDRTALNYLY